MTLKQFIYNKVMDLKNEDLIALNNEVAINDNEVIHYKYGAYNDNSVIHYKHKAHIINGYEIIKHYSIDENIADRSKHDYFKYNYDTDTITSFPFIKIMDNIDIDSLVSRVSSGNNSLYDKYIKEWDKETKFHKFILYKLTEMELDEILELNNRMYDKESSEYIHYSGGNFVKKDKETSSSIFIDKEDLFYHIKYHEIKECIIKKDDRFIDVFNDIKKNYDNANDLLYLIKTGVLK